VNILIDAHLSPRLARALGALFHGEHKVVHLRDKFGAGYWLSDRLAAQMGWARKGRQGWAETFAASPAEAAEDRDWLDAPLTQDSE
jgi:hypothetical protein